MLIDVLLPLDLVVLPLHLAMGKLPKNGKKKQHFTGSIQTSLHLQTLPASFHASHMRAMPDFVLPQIV